MDKKTFKPKWMERTEARMSATIEKHSVEIEHIKQDLAKKPNHDAVVAEISAAELRIEEKQTASTQKILGDRFDKIKFFVGTSIILGGLFLGSLWSGISAINQTRTELKNDMGEMEHRITNEQRASEQRILNAIQGNKLSQKATP